MKIGAAWLKQTDEGKSFLSCVIELPVIGKLNFTLWKNDEKSQENHPDYNITWRPDQS